MAYRCQELYLPFRQCRFETVGERDICRWHAMMEVLRRDLSRMPQSSQWLVAGGGLGFASFVVTVRAYAQESSHPIVLLAAIWSVACAIVFFCDGVIGMDYTLSRLPSLGRIMAWAMAVAGVSGFTLAVLIASLGQESAPVVATLTGIKHPWWMRNGYLVAGPVIATLSLFMVSVFVKAVLDRRIPSLALYGWAFIFTSAAPLVQTFGDRIGVTEERRNTFWAAALGPRAAWISGIGWVLGFIVCEMINVRMRQRECTSDEFRASVNPSFGACAAPPILSMLLIAWIFRQTGVSSPLVFVVATVVLSAILCRFVTRLVIRSVTA